jgi:hypothetical protein
MVPVWQLQCSAQLFFRLFVAIQRRLPVQAAALAKVQTVFHGGFNLFRL